MPRHAPSCHATCRRPRRSAAPYTMQRAQPAYRSPCGPDGLVRREQRVRSELGCARIACRAEQSRAEWSGAGTQVLLLAAVHGSGRRRAHARLRVSDPAGRQPTASPHPPARQSTLNRTLPEVPVLCTLLRPTHTHTHTHTPPPTLPLRCVAPPRTHGTPRGRPGCAATHTRRGGPGRIGVADQHRTSPERSHRRQQEWRAQSTAPATG